MFQKCSKLLLPIGGIGLWSDTFPHAHSLGNANNYTHTRVGIYEAMTKIRGTQYLNISKLTISMVSTY